MTASCARSPGPSPSPSSPLLDRYDVLLMDDRGRGGSDAIDCPAAQHGIGDFFAGTAACGAQLGALAGAYGTAASADDLDDLRAALGYDRLTFYGVSYGGVDIEAYATRHGEHLAAVVADSPWTSKADALQRFAVPAVKRVFALTCGRALGCAAQNRAPAATLAWLTRRLQQAPLTGRSTALAGTAVDVALDEASLLGYVLTSDAAAFAAPAELPAAARALRAGDAAPLLRIAAEQVPTDPFPLDSGELSDGFSAGSYLATWCADSLQLYDTTAPPAERERQYQAALDRLPPAAFAPFSIAGYSLFLRYYDGGDLCVPWPSPRVPVLAPGARYPSVPALVLTGDLDAIVPSEYDVEYASRWPRHTLVRLAGLGHDTLDASACATEIIDRFIATHGAGDTRCARVPQPAFATADFPVRSAAARVARPAPGDASGSAQRRAATVAVLTVLDALKRGALGEPPLRREGLRGGRFGVVARPDGSLIATLQQARFAADLRVSGRVTWDAEGFVSGTVDLAGAATGRLQLAGPLLVTTRDRLELTGTVDGRRLRALVPST